MSNTHSLAERAARLLLMLVLALTAVGVRPDSAGAADMSFTITGGGWGHGIGLSQYGAKGYAERGWSYGEIVRWYFGGERDYQDSETQVYTLDYVGKHPNPTVRVNIDSDYSTRSTWYLRSWKSQLRVRDAAGKSVLLRSPDFSYAFGELDGSVYVAGTKFTGTVRVSSEPTTGVSLPLVVIGSASGHLDRTNIRYRREIQLTVVDGELRAVNALPLEEYLYGVVPRESPASWPASALRAQAVAARSYAWASNPPSTATGGTLSGILHCTTWSQVYGGHSRLVGGDDNNIDMHEDSRTNAAVDASQGRVAYHVPTKKIIQTFFSSSTGGHTANIEDVWLSSTPKPYYKGVPDADQSGPDFRWDSAVKTGSQLASTLRAKDLGDGDLDYCAPSPATVVGVSHDKAGSGYVRRAYVRWSNGLRTTVSGDTMRNALGLKSTKFNIASPAWGPLAQETDSRLGWAGTWGVWNSSAHSGGTLKYTWSKGATTSFRFWGTGFRWYGVKWPRGGKADVSVDGVKVATVSLYSPTAKYRQPIYTVSGLGLSQPHNVTIKVLRTREASSTGYGVGIDSIRVSSGDLITR